ncbi:hypothetical protein GCM10027075_27530 [Streptomyces heilongjiangensis]
MTKAQVSDLGLSHGAGDENRTRALSLGSLDSLGVAAVPTCGAAALGLDWLVPLFPDIPRGSLHDLARVWHDLFIRF